MGDIREDAAQPATVGHRLRQARNRWFLGRDGELDLFRAALGAPEPPFTVLHVHGPGGVGKSALLRAFADDVERELRAWVQREQLFQAIRTLTDAADRATVVRTPDGYVDVRIQSGDNAPWFARRYNPAETREIRLYLHGGDDEIGDLMPGELTLLMGPSGSGKTTAVLTAIGYQPNAAVRLAGQSFLGESAIFDLSPAGRRALWSNRISYVAQEAASSLAC